MLEIFFSFTVKNSHPVPQFIIQAKDHTDAGALNRRLAVRQAHLQRMKGEKRKGIFITGGAWLNEEQSMAGSVIILALPDEESVWNWIEEDVYKTHRVWNEISVLPFRVADM